MNNVRILAADHVLPITSEPITGGAVAIDGARIVFVGKRDEVFSRYPYAAVDDLGKAAIIPGLVNCHSHLEITAMRGMLDSVEHDFRAWLLKLNNVRAGLSPGQIGAAAIAGAMEGVRAGVTCFGDIGRNGSGGMSALKATGLRGVLFQETEFSPDDRTADDDIARLREKYYELKEQETGRVEVGISPHAPYTVSRRLFEKIAEFASDDNIKITIHAAESADEDELVKNGRGFFIEVYKKFGLEWEPPRCSSIEFLAQTGILECRPLLAHCVTVSDNDIRLIADSGSRIVHCPKSNAKFGHGFAPYRKFADAGIDVGLGSDSVASNNVCDMLEESRFAALVARNLPGAAVTTAAEMLSAATIGGARALGLEDQIGSIEAGKKADMAVVSLSDIAQQPVNDVYSALVFSSNAKDVVKTLVDGETIYADGKYSGIDAGEIEAELSEIERLLRE